MAVSPEDKQRLRRRLIERRLALDPTARAAADAAINAALPALVQTLAARTVFAFLAHQGEPDLTPGLKALDADGVAIHLPRIQGRDMELVRWRPGELLQPNRYGIDEPLIGAVLNPEDCDLVLLPLTGYSPAGGRLGMGAGYYDRCFAFRQDPAVVQPVLVGVAYRLQQVEALPMEPWDVPLDAILTDEGLHWFQPR